MSAEIEEKHISGNRSVKVFIFPGAATHNMYHYLKPLLRKNPDNIFLHAGTYNLLNETSRDILNEILSSQNFIEKLCSTCKVTVSSLIHRSDNGKASLTVKHVNDHLQALNVNVVDNKNIGGNCLNNRGLHVNSTRYGKPTINFIRKMKNLSKNSWSLDSFCYNPNNFENVFPKITEFNKEKTWKKEHNSSQSAKSSESSNDLSLLDRIRLIGQSVTLIQIL